MKLLRIVVSAAAVFAVACSAPKLDGSSDEAFKASIARARERLPESKRSEFDAAIMGVAFQSFDLTKAATLGPDSMTSDARTKLNGKTADEVIAEFAKLEADRREKERQAAMRERDELIKERDAAKAARLELDKFVVERSRFSIDRSNPFMTETILHVRVKNGTTSPISRAYFHGRITSPGRSVPWVDGDFNYAISGGLEPGETADWNLKPNAFSEWSKAADASSDAGFEVTVVRLDGPGGKALFDSEQFSPEDQTRLAALETQLAEKK